MPHIARSSSTQPAQPVHVPLANQPWGIWRTFQEVRANVIRVIPELCLTQPIVSGRTVIRWHMVTDPDAIKRIVLDKLEDYPKSNVTKNLLRPAIGDSLFIAEGAHWRWQRRSTAPVFAHRNIQNLAPIMSAAAERCVARIDAAGTRAVNLFDEMVQTTFDVIVEVTFSDDESFDAQGVHDGINNYLQDAARLSILDLFGAPQWIPRPNQVFGSSAVRDMRALSDQAIAARRARGPKPIPDLLDLMLAAEDPEGAKRMNDAELRDNLLTFIVAGHETTALALSWALYLCAFDQKVQNQAREEAQAVLQNGIASGDDVSKLPYIRAIIDEALRLYPPAAFVSRTAQKRDELCGREVSPGQTIGLPIYALHRNRLLWEDADAFRPERFYDRKSIERYSYFPFGDGPRICIGASFALQEAVIILATLLAQYRFQPVPGRMPEPVMILTLRPEGGVWLTCEKIDAH